MVLGLEEGLVECATLCVKSLVILTIMGEMRISGFLFVPFQNFVDFGLINVGLGLGGPIIPIGLTTSPIKSF